MRKLDISYEFHGSIDAGSVGFGTFVGPVFKCAPILIGVLSNNAQVSAYFTYFAKKRSHIT